MKRNNLKPEDRLLQKVFDKTLDAKRKIFKDLVLHVLVQKLVNTRIEKIDFSMGHYFAVINGKQVSDNDFEYDNKYQSGYKREQKALDFYSHIMGSKEFNCLPVEDLVNKELSKARRAKKPFMVILPN